MRLPHGIAAFLFFLPLSSATAIEAINSIDAGEHLGETVWVRANVRQIGGGGGALLLIDHPNTPHRFDIAIDAKLRSSLEANKVDPKSLYRNQRVTVRGTIEVNTQGFRVIRVRESEDLHIALQSSKRPRVVADAADLETSLGEHVKFDFRVASMGIGGKNKKFSILSSIPKGGKGPPEVPAYSVRITDIGKAAFRDLGVKNVFTHFKDKNVAVTGVVDYFTRGKDVIPVVYVDAPGQIQAIDKEKRASSNAQAIPLVLNAEDFRKATGMQIRLRFRVAVGGWASKDPEVHLLSDKTASDNSERLIVWIDTPALQMYRDAGIEKVVPHFVGQLIEVTGTVEGRGANARVLVKSPDQIRILSEPTPLDQLANRVRRMTTVAVKVTGVSFNETGMYLKQRNRNASTPDVHIQFDSLGRRQIDRLQIGNLGNFFTGQDLLVSGVVTMSTNENGVPFPVVNVKSVADVMKSDGSLLFPSLVPSPPVVDTTVAVVETPPEPPKMKAPKVSPPVVDFALPKLTELVGKTVDLSLRDGRNISDVKITGVKMGEDLKSISTITAKIGSLRPREYRARVVDDLVVDGTPLNLEYDRDEDLLRVDSKAAMLRDLLDKENAARLRRAGGKLWARLSPLEHADWVKEHHAFLDTISDRYSNLALQKIETEYYILLSDIPERQLRPHISRLDALYVKLRGMFGLPEGFNIWCGKCVIVAFQNRADFIRFEVEMMNSQNPSGSGAICHYKSGGRSIVSLYKPGDADRFGYLLVSQTAYGMMHRYISNISLPRWLSAGMATWLAEEIVPRDDTFERNQKWSAGEITRTRTLEDFFESDDIRSAHYGCGGTLVDILVRKDIRRFGSFVRDIKLGYAQTEALFRNFELTLVDLSREYGRMIGVGNLRP